MQIYNPILIANKSLAFESLIALVDNKAMRLGRVEMLPVRHGTQEWFAQVASEGLYIDPYIRIRHSELTGPLLKPFEHIPIAEKKFFFFIFTEEFLDVFISTLRRIPECEAWIEYRELGNRGKRIARSLSEFLQSDGVESMRRLIKLG